MRRKKSKDKAYSILIQKSKDSSAFDEQKVKNIAIKYRLQSIFPYPGSTNKAGHSKEVSANSHTATTSISGCGGYNRSMDLALESWSRHISRADYLWNVNSRSSFHDRPDYSGMGVHSSNVGNGHGTFSTPF